MLMVCSALLPTPSLADDAGLIVSAGTSHKFNKKLTAGFDAEFRSRNNFRTAERVSLEANMSYKLLPWLKAGVSYALLIENNQETLSYHDDNTYNNWRPSYWGVRHRFNVMLTGSYKVQRVELSLRERWQYTYRPSKMIDSFNFDEGEWEDHEVKGKGKNVLRSRLQLDWDIPKCKFDPYASVEFHTSKKLDKTRIIAGVNYALKKKHNFKLYYRYQLTNGGPNIHMLGMGYSFKF